MRGFVCVVGVALAGSGLAACGSVVASGSRDASTGSGDAATDGKTGIIIDSVVPIPVDGGQPVLVCAAPPSWPSTKSWINLWKDADGHSGADNACPTVGVSKTTSNPQYIWCRRMGGVVSDGNGNHNYWWLWTDLDQGGDVNGRGWISAYYIKDQGNDQADDIYTGQPIPDCP